MKWSISEEIRWNTPEVKFSVFIWFAIFIPKPDAEKCIKFIGFLGVCVVYRSNRIYSAKSLLPLRRCVGRLFPNEFSPHLNVNE